MIQEEELKKISNLIYDELDYMYCNNCRFDSEVTEEQSREKYGSYRCEDCHRKYNGWGVSRAVADQLAEQICEEQELALSSLCKLNTFVCSVCGKTIYPKLVADDCGVFIQNTRIEYVGRANATIKSNVCEECAKKYRKVSGDDA